MEFSHYSRKLLTIIIAFPFCFANCTSEQVSVAISDNGATPLTLRQNYSLTCLLVSEEQSEYDLTYQWLKDGTVQSGTGTMFLFQPLELADSGLYNCTVTVNSTMSYSGTMDITLQIPSPTSVTVTSYTANPVRPVGINVTLTCTVELSPAVDVPVTVNTVWTGPDGFMTTNTSQPVMGSTTTYTSTMIVTSFGRNQSGIYTCNAIVTSNSQYLTDSSKSGSKNVTTGVYLSQNGNIIQNNSDIFFTHIGKTNNPLVCTSDRMPCCRNPSQYGEWKFSDGSQVIHITETPRPSTFHRNRDNFGNVNLFRVNNDVSQAGKVCCEIPDATDTNQTLCVNIKLIVQIVHGNQTVGQPYTLTCSISGATTANTNYHWEKNSNQLSHNGPTLSFTSSRLSDAGRYTCNILIHSFSYRNHTEIILQIPPPASMNVDSTPSSPIRPIGTDVMLTCTVVLPSGTDSVMVNIQLSGPNPSVSQLATNSSNTSSTYKSSALIRSFGRDKSGMYNCSVMVSSTSPFLRNNYSQFETANVTTGVYLSQNGNIIENDSDIFFTQIGTTNSGNPLVCTSDRMPCCRDQPQYGEWKFSDGSQVKHIGENPSTFHRSRDDTGNVYLFRVNDNVFQAGRTCCEIPDATDTNQTLCVNILFVQVSGTGVAPELGTGYELTCRVIGGSISNANYQWQENGIIKPNENGQTLTFSSLSLSDAVQYTCIVSFDTLSSRNHTDIVLQIPSPISVIVTSDPVSPIQSDGSDVTLTCTVELSPLVDVPVTVNTVWTGPTGFMTTNTTQPVMGSTYSSLVIISSFGRDRYGNYTCSVSVSSANTMLTTSDIRNGSSRVTTGVYLFLNGVVIESDSNVVITDIGTSQHPLVCITDKNPCCATPNRAGEWIFPNGSAVTNMATHPTQFYRNRGSSGQVNLYRVSDDVITPTGRFCCRVPDAIGVTRTVCTNVVSVQINTSGGIPTIGQNYSLTCLVPGADSDVTYQWHKNNEDITDRSEVTDNMLTIMPLRLSDAGNYICNVSVNSIMYTGNKDVSIKLPTLTNVKISSDQNGRVTVGSDVTIQCTVVMTKLEVDVNVTIHLSDSTGKMLFTNTVQSLSISSNTYTSTATINLFGRNESGIYTCNATYFSPDNPFLLDSDPHIETLRVTVGVYLSSNGTMLDNDSDISIFNIGETDPSNPEATNNGLQCITDKMPCCDRDQLGKWLFPDGSTVPEQDNATSFYINRGLNDGTVNLNRLNDSVLPTGKFCCVVADAEDKSNFICIMINGVEPETTLGTGDGLPIPIIAGSVGGALLLFGILCILTTLICALTKKRNKKEDIRQYGFLDDNVAKPNKKLKNKPEAIELKQAESDDKNYTDKQDFAGNSVPLSEFIEYVDNMHADRDAMFEDEFLSLCTIPTSSHDASDIPYNNEKNRFINIFPYDYNRVELREIPAVEGSDYINASYLDGYDKQKAYIAAQGPLPNTLEDFWRMIWEQKLPTIVMLTKCFEDRKKCECYWPENIGEPFIPGHNLTVNLTAKIPFSEYVIRKMTVEHDSETNTPPLEVIQLHFTAWPDHGVPSNTSIMLNIIRRVRKLHPYSDPRPLLVHCSAGVGRTGTFIVLDSMLERMKTEESFNIFGFIQQRREERVLMVQSLAQYMFIHDALKELIMCGETEIIAPNLGIVINRLSKAKDGTSGFDQQFQTLEKLNPKWISDSFTTARAETNAEKNRYPDKIPCDGTSRTALRCNGEQGTDYINASYVNGYKQRRAYIATQGPLESTVNDFWRMVWEQKSCCIVMLCHLKENDKDMSVRYWPSEEDGPQDCGKVMVKKITEENRGDFVVRRFEVDEKKQQTSSLLNVKTSFIVTQFQFFMWPEHETPPITSSLIELIDKVNKVQMGSGNRPMIVMCNDGVGRAGTFICIHAQLERLKTEGVVDFFQFVKSARIQRPGVILNVGQYRLCHSTVLQYLQSCDAYANFKDVV